MQVTDNANRLINLNQIRLSLKNVASQSKQFLALGLRHRAFSLHELFKEFPVGNVEFKKLSISKRLIDERRALFFRNLPIFEGVWKGRINGSFHH